MGERTVDTGAEPVEQPRSRRALLQAAGVAAGAVAFRERAFTVVGK